MATYADAQRIVASLPGGEEVIVVEWGDHPTFRVNNKMFASGAPDSPTMSVKASKEDQAELVAARPDTFAVARYVGRFGWVEDPDGNRIELWEPAPEALIRPS